MNCVLSTLIIKPIFLENYRLKPFHQCVKPQFPPCNTSFSNKIFHTVSCRGIYMDEISSRVRSLLVFLSTQTFIAPKLQAAFLQSMSQSTCLYLSFATRLSNFMLGSFERKPGAMKLSRSACLYEPS